MLNFRLRMYMIGRNIRWMVMALAAASIWFEAPVTRAYFATVYAMLGVATLYNLALYVVPWRRLEEEGRGNLIVIPYVLADTVCISIFIYATGQIQSSFFLTYLLLVVWMAIYPGLRGKPELWFIVVASYAVAVFWGTVPTGPMIFDFTMRAVIFGFVAWLSNRIATEHHAATSKLEHIMHDLTDGVVALDRSGRVALVNPRAAELMDISAAEALGRRPDSSELPPTLAPLQELVPPPDAPGLQVHGDQVRAHEAVLGGAQERVVRVYSSPYDDGMGGRGGELRVLQDVTDLKQLDRLRADFMSAVTHDLRNPLATIRVLLLNLQNHLASPGDADCEQMLSLAQHETDRLVRLTGELLDSARIEAGRLVLSFAAVDLASQIAEVTQSAEWAAKERGLTLTSSAGPDLPPVRADADRLTRVLYNIVDNAVKCTPRGGTVAITAGRCPHDPGKAQVSVADTGVGIEPDKLATIFDRFVRAENSLALKTSGAGLGLAISRELVDAHGGRLWVESQWGRGSTFHFTVPFVDAAGAAVASAADLT